MEKSGTIMHGAEMHLNTNRRLYIPAMAAADPAFMGTRDNYACGCLADTGGCSVTSTIQVPSNYVSGGTLKPIFSAYSVADVYTSISAHYAAIGGTYTDNNDWKDGVTSITAIDTFIYGPVVVLTNLSIDDVVGVSTYRDPDNAGDTLSGNLYLMGYYFDYMADQ